MKPFIRSSLFIGVLSLAAGSAGCGASPTPLAPTSSTPASSAGSPAAPGSDERGLQPLPAAAPPASDVAVTVVPGRPWLDTLHGAQRLSCDFRLHNAGPARRLEEISLTVIDRSGAQVSRRSIDAHGVAPAIAMIPNRAIAAGGDLYLFNPFETFPAELPISKLRFRFGFKDEAGARTFTEVVVVPRRYERVTPLAVPVDGNVLVAGGNSSFDPHRRLDLDVPFVKAIGMTANSGRYAVDLTPVDDRGQMFTGDGTSLDQWRGYHATVRAPADAKVAFVINAVPDNRLTRRGVEFTVDPTTPGTILGNMIVLDHGRGEFALFAHLAQGSITVKVGDLVVAGQPIGKIGFSGNADFVHTHYQLMAGPDARTAEGLPIQFARFTRLLGGTALEATNEGIQTGDIIRSRAPAP
jgi:hypothetical protein